MSSVHLLLCLPLDLLPLTHLCTMFLQTACPYLILCVFILFSNCLSSLSFSSIHSLVFRWIHGILSIVFSIPTFQKLLCVADVPYSKVKVKGKGKRTCIAPLMKPPQGAQVWITQDCPCKLHHTCLYLANVRQMAPPKWQTSNSSSLLIY